MSLAFSTLICAVKDDIIDRHFKIDRAHIVSVIDVPMASSLLIIIIIIIINTFLKSHFTSHESPNVFYSPFI